MQMVETIRDNNITVHGINDTWGAVYLVGVGSADIFGNNITDFGQAGLGIVLIDSTAAKNVYDNDIMTSGSDSYGCGLIAKA